MHRALSTAMREFPGLREWSVNTFRPRNLKTPNVQEAWSWFSIKMHGRERLPSVPWKDGKNAKKEVVGMLCRGVGFTHIPERKKQITVSKQKSSNH